MSIQNTAEKFGSLTKILHWTIATLFFAQFFLIYRRDQMPDDAPEKLQYILLHKSFGVCILILALCMILWRQVGTRPILPLNMSTLEVFAAKLVHFLLYLFMLVMPLSGFLMSSYAGYGVKLFGYPLPNPVSKNEDYAHFFGDVHETSAYIIAALVIGHTLAALYHHFVRKDNILKRMM
jgi:cytochrome b561